MKVFWKTIKYASLIFILPTSMAFAHGLSKFISTPLTAPVELFWVQVVYLFLFITINTIYYRKNSQNSCGRALLFSLFLLFCFYETFIMIGVLAASRSTAPPPGLSPYPFHSLWGLGWKDGALFLRWNLYGLAILVFWTIIFFKPWRLKFNRFIKILVLNAGLYLLCLLPYGHTAALSHGYAGIYMSWYCPLRIEKIEKGLVDYAKDHEGKLPIADNIEEVLIKIAPYLEDKPLAELDTCPVAEIFIKNPAKYIWNPKLSGISIRQFIDNDLSILLIPLIICPYHYCINLKTSTAIESKKINIKKTNAIKE